MKSTGAISDLIFRGPKTEVPVLLSSTLWYLLDQPQQQQLVKSRGDLKQVQLEQREKLKEKIGEERITNRKMCNEQNEKKPVKHLQKQQVPAGSEEED